MKLNISKIAPRIAKRARVSGVVGLTLSIIALLTYTIYAQQRGTPSQIRVKIDSTGALAVSSAAITNPVSVQTFINARLKVDASGNLVITDGSGSGFAPADATYVTRTANTTLTNEFSLGTLATGILLNTVTGSTGVLTSLGSVLSVANGGWGLSTLTIHNLYAGNGASAPTAIPGGTNCIVWYSLSSVDPTCSVTPIIATNIRTPTFRSISNSTTQDIYRFGTGAATNIFAQWANYSGGNLGVEFTGITKSLDNPGISIEGIGPFGNATFPIVNSYIFSGDGVNLIAGTGQLWGWQNFGEESNSILWCKTDQANCTSVVTGGAQKYIFDFSRPTASILKFAIGRFTTAILADVDNTIDIGASGATRPRTGYFGTSVITPTMNATSAYQANGVAGATHSACTAITAITVTQGLITSITCT